jgi:hypothetical protein
MQEHLGRDATHVGAGASVHVLVAFNQYDPASCISESVRRGLSSLSESDDENISSEILVRGVHGSSFTPRL